MTPQDQKEEALDRLTRPLLFALAEQAGLTLPSSSPKDVLVDALLRCRVVALLAGLSRDVLREIARCLGARGARSNEALRLNIRDAIDGLIVPRATGRVRARWFRESLAGSAPPLRDYQQQALRAAEAWLSADTPGLIHMATGAGKTRAANELVASVLESGEDVLWTTFNWMLLEQAARGLARRLGGADSLRRVGGYGQRLHPLGEWVDADRDEPCVVYTTLRTFASRAEEFECAFDDCAPGLIVYDEAHRGEDGLTGSTLLDMAREFGVPVLGLSATPRPAGLTRFEPIYSKTFCELVDEGVLARPIIEDPVHTGVSWSARLDPTGSDFSNASLKELGRSAQRNAAIVKELARRRASLGPTILFACSIRHCNELERLLTRAGLGARAFHSDCTEEQQARALAEFRAGDIQILINVEKLTTGVDLPLAETLVFARPTLSAALYAQMIGRGARRTENKVFFRVLEFTQNMDRYQGLIMSPTREFPGAGASAGYETGRSVALRERHSFDPGGTILRYAPGRLAPDYAGATFLREGQTFGVELELVGPGGAEAWESPREWSRHAGRLLGLLQSALPSGTVAAEPGPGEAESQHRLWRCVPDASCGYEITTRILSGEAGLRELARGCDALTAGAAELGFYPNARCGVHVHLAWDAPSVEVLKTYIRLVKLLEPAFGGLVAPSRLRLFTGGGYDLSMPNTYAQPLGPLLPSEVLDGINSEDELFDCIDGDRYRVVNLAALEEGPTVEIRGHSGSTEARKILPWLSLHAMLLHAAERLERDELPVPDDAGLITPGDPVQILNTLGLAEDLGPELLADIEARHDEVRRLWRAIPALRGWL